MHVCAPPSVARIGEFWHCHGGVRERAHVVSLVSVPMPSAQLQDKTAIVTGGTSGIGRRIVERFCAEGASVLFTGRRAELGADVARQSGAIFHRADVTADDDADATIAAAREAFGHVDILVNNAGEGGRKRRVEDLPVEEFDHLLRLHLRAAFIHIRAVAQHMRDRGTGSIVNISSIAGHRAGQTSIAYSVAKAGLQHLTRCTAMDLGESGVRVNTISPGLIATGIHSKTLGASADEADGKVEQIEALLSGWQAVPRAGRVDDVAAAAVFLASDQGGFINGEDLVIDGGLIWGQRFSRGATLG